MVIITVRTSGSTDDLMVRRVADSTRVSPLSLASLSDRNDVQVSLTFHGPGPAARFNVSLVTLLKRALEEGGASSWLSGPLATEGRFEVPVTGSLRLVTDIRLHADGVVRTDLQFNNDIAMTPGGGPLIYDVAILSGNQTIFRQHRIHHYQYQTWHQEIWSDGREEPHIVHDTLALARAGAVPSYDITIGVNANVLTRMAEEIAAKEFRILGSAGLARYMPTTGGRGDIGITTFANATWLVTQHPIAKRFALAQADAAGSVPWHFHDRAVGTALSPIRHPTLWVDYRGGQWGTTGLTQPLGQQDSGWTPDNAHQPELSYVAFILTGSRYRYDQLEAQALFSIFAQNPDYRGRDKGIVVNTTEQVRGRAWAFRAVEQAAFTAPDSAPLQSYFRSAVANNIAFLQSEMRWRTMGETYGAFGDGSPGNMAGGVTGPWQQDFLAATLSMAAARGVPGAAEVVAWMANFIAGRFISGDKGFPPVNGTAFYLVIAPENGKEPYLTWHELQATNVAKYGARDGSEVANAYPVTLFITRGTLASMSSVVRQPEIHKALNWVNTQLRDTVTVEMARDPTWNIVPLLSPGG